jgi:hypothetical protein
VCARTVGGPRRRRAPAPGDAQPPGCGRAGRAAGYGWVSGSSRGKEGAGFPPRGVGVAASAFLGGRRAVKSRRAAAAAPARRACRGARGRRRAGAARVQGGAPAPAGWWRWRRRRRRRCADSDAQPLGAPRRRRCGRGSASSGVVSGARPRGQRSAALSVSLSGCVSALAWRVKGRASSCSRRAGGWPAVGPRPRGGAPEGAVARCSGAGAARARAPAAAPRRARAAQAARGRGAARRGAAACCVLVARQKSKGRARAGGASSPGARRPTARSRWGLAWQVAGRLGPGARQRAKG